MSTERAWIISTDRDGKVTRTEFTLDFEVRVANCAVYGAPNEQGNRGEEVYTKELRRCCEALPKARPI